MDGAQQSASQHSSWQTASHLLPAETQALMHRVMAYNYTLPLLNYKKSLFT